MCTRREAPDAGLPGVSCRHGQARLSLPAAALQMQRANDAESKAETTQGGGGGRRLDPPLPYRVAGQHEAAGRE